MHYPELTEEERFPLLSAEGRRFLRAMRQDASAPRWNWPNGEQLDAAGLFQVRQFAVALEQPRTWSPDRPPEWLDRFVDFCLEEVPFYRNRSDPGTRFAEIPSCNRDCLAPQVWEFVPDGEPLDRLIVFSSSGTTGHPAKMPSHPATAACGIPLLEYALRDSGIRFPRGVDQMALTNVAAYRGAYTTAIVMAYLDEAGCIRVNLRPEPWHKPQDCRAYLDRWSSPIVLGDPQSLETLAQIGLEKPPQAILSSIFHLSDAFAAQLTSQFGCPIIDLYALTEAGIVAKRTQAGHVILPHDLYVEILDERDQPCPAGTRGEITLTGGRNPFCPLLRYRTGDHASLEWIDGQPTLVGLEGRQPVVFFSARGEPIHSMEVTRRLRVFPLVQYTLRQDREGGLHFGRRGMVDDDDLRTALVELFGTIDIAFHELESPGPPSRKFRVYESEYAPRGVRVE